MSSSRFPWSARASVTRALAARRCLPVHYMAGRVGDGSPAARLAPGTWCDIRVTTEAGSGPGPVVIDGGDRSCVQLLLELCGHIARHPPGTVVHLIATDPAAPLDLAAWCHLTGHRYLGAAGASLDCRPVYALQVSGSPCPTDPASPWRLA
jgi:tRNA 2-thiouridine synthesizing protein A